MEESANAQKLARRDRTVNSNGEIQEKNVRENTMGFAGLRQS